MDWSSAIPILVGGVISLVASLLMFAVAAWYDRRQKKIQTEFDRGTAAVFGMHKLVHTLDFIENTARHIDNEFSDQDRNAIFVEPSALVRPIVGARASFAFVELDELLFLSGSDGDLFARIFEIQKRAMNIDALVTKYNELRLEYDTFSEDSIVAVEGGQVTKEFEGKAKFIAEAKIGRLNQLVAGLIGLLEEDRKTALIVVQDYIAQLKHAYPQRFSKLKFEYRESDIC